MVREPLQGFTKVVNVTSAFPKDPSGTKGGEGLEGVVGLVPALGLEVSRDRLQEPDQRGDRVGERRDRLELVANQTRGVRERTNGVMSQNLAGDASWTLQERALRGKPTRVGG